MRHGPVGPVFRQGTRRDLKLNSPRPDSASLPNLRSPAAGNSGFPAAQTKDLGVAKTPLSLTSQMPRIFFPLRYSSCTILYVSSVQHELSCIPLIVIIKNYIPCAVQHIRVAYLFYTQWFLPLYPLLHISSPFLLPTRNHWFLLCIWEPAAASFIFWIPHRNDIILFFL